MPFSGSKRKSNLTVEETLTRQALPSTARVYFDGSFRVDPAFLRNFSAIMRDRVQAGLLPPHMLQHLNAYQRKIQRLTFEPQSSKGTGFWLATDQGPVLLTNYHVVNQKCLLGEVDDVWPRNESRENIRRSNQFDVPLTRSADTEITAQFVNPGLLKLPNRKIRMRVAKWPNDKSKTAETIGRYTGRDLAVLVPENPNQVQGIKPLVLNASRDALKPGDLVYSAIARNYRGGILSGAVTNIRERLDLCLRDDIFEIESTLETKAGDSGSPVLNAQGQVVGIHKLVEPRAGEEVHVATAAYSIADQLAKWGFFKSRPSKSAKA